MLEVSEIFFMTKISMKKRMDSLINGKNNLTLDGIKNSIFLQKDTLAVLQLENGYIFLEEVAMITFKILISKLIQKMEILSN